MASQPDSISLTSQLKILRIFFGAQGTRPFLVLLCLLIAGIFEAASLSAMLPAVTQLNGGATENSSELNLIVTNGLRQLGLVPTLPVLLGVGVLAMVIKSVLSFLARTYVGYAFAVVSTTIRKRLLNALFSASWVHIISLKTGSIANTISLNATKAGLAYFMAARSIALMLQGLVYLIVAFFISYKMALVGCVFGILLVVLLSGFISFGRRAGYKQTDRTGELVAHVADALGNIKPIKTMHRQAGFLAYSAGRIRALRRALINAAIAREGLVYGQEILTAIAIGVGVYLAASLWNIPFPELIVLGVIAFQIIAIVSKVQKSYQKVTALEGAYMRCYEQIEDLEQNAETDDGTLIPSLNEAIRFSSVDFSDNGKSIIKDASLEIPTGGITVLQGPSGSGKTTLINLLVGLLEPDSGGIFIDGDDLSDLSLKAWRSMIGYVPQELSLLHGSIAGNIALGNEDTSVEEIQAALDLAGASKFVASQPNGIDTDVGEMGAKLSGGQRQRISLARALVGKPKLLILDEVTSALDPETEQAICDRVAGLRGNYTIVVITHRPAWTAIATRLYTVDAGSVRAGASTT